MRSACATSSLGASNELLDNLSRAYSAYRSFGRRELSQGNVISRGCDLVIASNAANKVLISFVSCDWCFLAKDGRWRMASSGYLFTKTFKDFKTRSVESPVRWLSTCAISSYWVKSWILGRWSCPALAGEAAELDGTGLSCSWVECWPGVSKVFRRMAFLAVLLGGLLSSQPGNLDFWHFWHGAEPALMHFIFDFL